jgi:hypothetical protein
LETALEIPVLQRAQDLRVLGGESPAHGVPLVRVLDRGEDEAPQRVTAPFDDEVRRILDL